MATAKNKGTAAVPAETTMLLRALEPVRADGVDFAPGEVFELGEIAAGVLIAVGIATPELQPAAA
jgi:hypothetical protein